ncbi:hypothetical protein GQ53DRAFT_426689 [Thozetella sp. PMI_491]|nr:hypothetical protein GQ53DRAFT_426689 [Thozetella sp. PMI_491]
MAFGQRRVKDGMSVDPYAFLTHGSLGNLGKPALRNPMPATSWLIRVSPSIEPNERMQGDLRRSCEAGIHHCSRNTAEDASAECVAWRSAAGAIEKPLTGPSWADRSRRRMGGGKGDGRPLRPPGVNFSERGMHLLLYSLIVLRAIYGWRQEPNGSSPKFHNRDLTFPRGIYFESILRG